MNEILKSAEDRMKKTISILVKNFSEINAGRANPALLERILVNYYQTPTKITQLASINVVSGSTLVIQPFDASILSEVERSISISDLGVNPQNDGKTIKLNFPPPTEEKRKNIVKEISKNAEDTKVSIRNIRRDVIDKLKKMLKDSEITQDVLNKSSNRVQDLTNKYVENIDQVSSEKQEEVMKI